MRYVLLLALLAPAAHAGEDAELRFLRAWYAVGEPGKRAAAEETFRLLHETESTPEDVKARCLLGLAECARLQGDEPKARQLLERLLAAHEGTEAAARARRILGGGGYLDRIVVVPDGSFLDLDDATLSGVRRPIAGKEAEMRDGDILVEPTAEPGFALLVGGSSGKPWYRVRTSEGRSSWVQVLERWRGVVVRVVTRLSGVGDVLPAPRDPFCLGVAEGIEVRFEPSRAFARYRIERGTGGEEPLEIGVVEEPPFLDATAAEGVRYLYRITGEDAGGAWGLPATIEGTRQSRGVVEGVAEMNRTDRRGFDFLLGVPVDPGDVTVTSIFGDWDGASFVDALGREVRPLAPPAGDPRVVWDEESEGTGQIPAGSLFAVPLRGGGVARCRLEIPAEDRRAQGVEAILHYEACGDGGVLPQPARLAAKRDETGAIVTVEVKPPYRVEQVEVKDLITGRALAPLRVVDGAARDPEALEGQVREYRAVAVDPNGRRSVAAVATLALFPEGPRAGEFRFHYQQGFSLETGRIVDAQEADVFFQTCAGGIHSITLAAPGGIVNLKKILGDLNPGRADAIFDLVVSADPLKIQLAPRAEADSRTPSSDVFLLRTRHGGWAKLAITHRARDGDWMKLLATVRYVFNGKEPVFARDGGQELGGVRFRDLKRLRARAAILKQWQQGWREIAAQGGALEDEARAGGEMPDPEKTQEVLWSRQRYKDYVKATFSFVFGTRDDPELRQTRNDWCLQYGNGGNILEVRMVTDDESTITDLGASDWASLARRGAIEERDAERVPARFGHIYLVHTLDTDENFFTLLRVTALRPGDKVAFEWVSRRGERLVRSPGLALDGPAEKAIAALLAALPATPEKRWEGREHARAVHMRLQEPEILIGVADADTEAFLRDLSEIAGVRIVLKAEPAGPISVFGARVTPERILDSISEQTGLRWRIEDDGSVSLGAE